MNVIVTYVCVFVRVRNLFFNDFSINCFLKQKH